MSESRQWQTVTREHGRAKMMRGAEHLGEVDYKLQVDRERVSVRTGAGVETIPGQVNGRGEFKATGPMVNVADGEVVVLHREGRPDIQVTIVTSLFGQGGSIEIAPASRALFDSPK